MTGTVHIVLAMKPLEGNFAGNALKHGIAGLNIDGTRIVFKDKRDFESAKFGTQTDMRGGGFCNKRPSDGFVLAKGVEANPSGRWPSNVVLSHLDGCRCVGTKKVKSDGHHSYKIPDGGGLYKLGMKSLDDKGNPHADADGKETVESWECEEDCPVRKMSEQSGKAGAGGRASGPTCRKLGTKGIYGDAKGDGKDSPFYADNGTAARFFKQVRIS